MAALSFRLQVSQVSKATGKRKLQRGATTTDEGSSNVVSFQEKDYGGRIYVKHLANTASLYILDGSKNLQEKSHRAATIR